MLDYEIAHSKLTELHVVETMHERKALMAERASAFIALPGGLGTFEEILEIATWGQLNQHQKPMIIYNVNRFYDALIAQLDYAVEEGFLPPQHRAKVIIWTKLQDIAKVPDSVRIDEYERKNGVICGRWSANNPFGQRISTRFVYVESIKSLSVEPERAYSPEDELLHSMFLSSWRRCDGS